jgi:hypothetical protein
MSGKELIVALGLLLCASSTVCGQQAAEKLPIPFWGVYCEVVGDLTPDSLQLSLFNYDSYLDLVQFEHSVVVVDSLSGYTIRLFSEEEIRKRRDAHRYYITTPPAPSPTSKYQDE